LTVFVLIGSMDQPDRVVRDAERTAAAITIIGIASYVAALVLGVWAFVIWVRRRSDLPPFVVAMLCALVYGLALLPAIGWYRLLYFRP
jgi:hypothetical protein